MLALAVEPRRLLVEGEKSVVLDALDPGRGIGFELRGNGCREAFCRGAAEDPAEALDAAEFDWLTARGLRRPWRTSRAWCSS